MHPGHPSGHTRRFGGDEVAPIAMDEARILVLPLCYEHQVSYGPGTQTGPLHLLEASAQLEALDEETFTDWTRLGIHTCEAVHPEGAPEQAVEQMADAVRRILKENAFLLALGGDHAVSIGAIRAVSENHPALGVLQIDAHLDLRDAWNGSRWNHACVMRRVIDDLGLPCVQAGIRSVAPEELEVVRSRRLDPFYAHDMAVQSADEWIGQVLAALPETVYLTLDLDALDPALMPGTGTPEPGGLGYRDLLKLISALGEAKRVVAADIVELCKIPGSQVSEYTAAKIAMKMMVHFTA